VQSARHDKKIADGVKRRRRRRKALFSRADSILHGVGAPRLDDSERSQSVVTNLVAKVKAVDLFDRKPPKSSDMERELLIAVLANGVIDGLEGLQRNDLTDPIHWQLFDAMKTLQRRGAMWLDTRVVLMEMPEGDRKELVANWLAEWRESIGVVANIPYYKAALRELRKRRALLLIAAQTMRRAHDEHEPIDTTRAWISKQLEHLDAI